MAQATINRLRDLIRSLNYAVSIHAAEELEDAVVKIAPDGNLFVITV